LPGFKEKYNKSANKPVSPGQAFVRQLLIDCLYTGNNQDLSSRQLIQQIHITAQSHWGLPLYVFLFAKMVPRVGLEPTHISTPEPKSGASTNFATRA